ncbi:MAG: Maf family protein [Candidatus Gallimonas sp.]
MKRLILASASPRRRELLAQIAREFSVESSRFPERAVPLSAEETAGYFAREKAREVARRFPDCAVLGADTVVASDGAILGKPRDKADAKRTLSALSGKTHEVITGVCLVCGGRERTVTVTTRVRFFRLTDDLIERYAESGLPLDKAGSYGIQDGYPLVERFEGSYTNVVGLPLEATAALLKEEGLC